MNEWFPIPFYSRYEITEDGVVRNKQGKIIGQYENKTTKGTYLVVNIKNDNGKRVVEGVHRLVCLAFHGVPDHYPKIDANHKLGDKHNNHKDNLEWATRSQNVKHAFETGLNEHALKVEMQDHLTSTRRQFTSVRDVEAYFNVNRGLGWHLVTKHQTVKYLDRYTFSFQGEYLVPKFKHNVGVCIFDMVDMKFYRTTTIAEASLYTGLSRTAIQQNLRHPKRPLLCGCLIWKTDETDYLDRVKNVTDSMIGFSLEQYNQRSKPRPKVTSSATL